MGTKIDSGGGGGVFMLPTAVIKRVAAGEGREEGGSAARERKSEGRRAEETESVSLGGENLVAFLGGEEAPRGAGTKTGIRGGDANWLAGRTEGYAERSGRGCKLAARGDGTGVSLSACSRRELTGDGTGVDWNVRGLNGG